MDGGSWHWSSAQFSHPVVSDSLRPLELQHARPPCPSPSPGVYPNSCPLSRWCRPTITSSVVPFSSCLQSFPTSGSFQMSQLKMHSICQQIWKAYQWPKDRKRSVFIPIPKKGNAKESSDYCTIVLISHTSKVMLKILQVRLVKFRCAS